MNRRIVHRLLAVAFAALVLSSPARAIDGVAIEGGTSDSSNADVNRYGVALTWNWSKRWALGADWHIGGYWELSAAYWDNDSPNRTYSSLWDVGFTPVFRLQQTNPSTLSPYLEAGIGVHFLSHTSVSTQRQFGSSFQFGDHIGVGFRFGPRAAFDLGYRFQHLSNAGIKQPNNGINFHQIRLLYQF